MRSAYKIVVGSLKRRYHSEGRWENNNNKMNFK
jgi:hypothetical protein